MAVLALYGEKLDTFIIQIKIEFNWMCGISVKSSDHEFVLLCVYLPCESPHNVDEYINCLAALETCIQELNTATVYIVGDFNVDFQPNAHCTTLLRDFVGTNDLIISDCVFNKNVFSYISDAWSTTSWLDISSSDAHSAIKSARFLDDFISSDHIPLCLSIEFNIIPTFTHKNDNVHGSSFIKHNWVTASKRAIEVYSKLCNEIQSAISSANISAFNCEYLICQDQTRLNDLDVAYDIISSHLVSSADRAFAPSGGNNLQDRKCYTTIPGWKEHVKDAHIVARESFLIWQKAGKPHSGPFFENMKHSKSLFKYTLRHCRRRENQLRADSLDKDLSMKSYKDFWNGVKAQRASNISSVGGCDGDSNVLVMWSDHYKVIFSSTVHDDAALDALHEVLDSVPANTCDFLESYEVDKSITKLNRGKSMDLNGLSPEHVIYASESIAEPLALLFTSMLIHGYMPKEMIKSMIVPIIKSKTRSITDKSNYRPVAISTVMSKLFELLLLDRLEPYLTTMDNQFGFKKHHGTELCVFTLTEALRFYHSEGTPMFLCFLDASATFDRISFEILFSKLLKRDVPLYVIRILYFWNFNQQICVRWNSLLSDFFPVTNGVRQGGILSSFLFNVYMDDLSKSLNKLSVGCYMKGKILNHLMYAGDNVLLAPSLKGLQKLLNITYSYGTAHGILFNKL